MGQPADSSQASIQSTASRLRCVPCRRSPNSRESLDDGLVAFQVEAADEQGDGILGVAVVRGLLPVDVSARNRAEHQNQYDSQPSHDHAHRFHSSSSCRGELSRFGGTDAMSRSSIGGGVQGRPLWGRLLSLQMLQAVEEMQGCLLEVRARQLGQAVPGLRQPLPRPRPHVFFVREQDHLVSALTACRVSSTACLRSASHAASASSRIAAS